MTVRPAMRSRMLAGPAWLARELTFLAGLLLVNRSRIVGNRCRLIVGIGRPVYTFPSLSWADWTRVWLPSLVPTGAT